MARISTYQEDSSITGDDILLGSSAEGTFNGNTTYATKNFKLSELASFFNVYDPGSGVDLTSLTNRVTTLENAGYLTEHPNITAASSVDNSGSTFIQDITLDSNGHIVGIESAVLDSSDLTSFQVLTNTAGTASLTYDNTSGDFTYTPPDLSSFITSVSFSDLTSTPTTLAGYGITDGFDGSYTSLTNVPTEFAPESHNHDDLYYTETEVDTLLSGYLTTSTDIGDLSNVSSATPSTGQVLKWDGSEWAPSTDLQASGGTGITLADLSVSVASAGTANLSYNNTSGTFTYTPPDVSGYIGLTSISVGAEASASGNGGLAYDNTTGVFTYTPPDFSGSYLSTSGGTLTGNLILASGADLTLQGGDVSITGNLSVSGAFTVGTTTGDLRGDVYSIVGSTSSVKVLESGSGDTPDAYFIGDLRNSQSDQVFDTSTATFRKDVSIGLNNTSTNNLNMHGGSKIWFDEGISEQEQYIDKVKVSQWDAAVLTSSKFQMGQTTGSPQEDLIQFNINGASGLTSSLSIKPGTYLSASTDTDDHVLLDVNNTALADIYVGKTGSQIMQGPLSITAGNLTVSGNGTFIEGDGKIDIYDTSATPVKILDHINGWFKGNIRGGDLQDGDGNTIFDSSESTFETDVSIGVDQNNTNDLNMHGGSKIWFDEGITDQETYVDKTKINTWDSQEQISNIYFYEEGTTDTFRLRLRKQTDDFSRNTSVLIEKGAYMTMSVTDDTTDSYTFDSNTIGALNIGLNYAGLESQLDSVYARLGASISGVTVNSGSAITGTLNIEDGTSISAIRDGSTNNISLNFVKGTGATGYLQQQDGDARYIRQTGTGFEAAQNGIMLKTGANAYGVTVNNSSNWDTAFGWGNHADAGYLELAENDNPANGEVATFDSDGKIVSSSITGVLPSTTVFTTNSPDFGSNTITAGNFILSSDRDLKENIIPLAEREIKVDFKEYNFKGSDRTRFGVIAQELEENHPEFVHTRESGDKSVAYIDLLVAKVHELENRIKELENGARNR